MTMPIPEDLSPDDMKDRLLIFIDQNAVSLVGQTRSNDLRLVLEKLRKIETTAFLSQFPDQTASLQLALQRRDAQHLTVFARALIPPSLLAAQSWSPAQEILKTIRDSGFRQKPFGRSIDGDIAGMDAPGFGKEGGVAPTEIGTQGGGRGPRDGD